MGLKLPPGRRYDGCKEQHRAYDKYSQQPNRSITGEIGHLLVTPLCLVEIKPSIAQITHCAFGAGPR
ncbi:hypothetical protein DES40_1339 [Litorimonas taeanensis]|uniref:Uncharacterized protein n=1 Tax=Litorimonas taeanensis TaxID=568099 RepID=A0A420WLV9_9PROT|nr:hypothetical protein DES40_1339 [Litorimonas taeanensis]